MADNDNLVYMKPNKVFRKLKAAEENNTTVYIYGVTGIGKTELIRRYLGSRKYVYIEAGRQYIDEIRVPDGGNNIVVIDNLHELAADDNDDIKQKIIELIERSDVWVILSGRSDVPPWLTAVRYKEVFCCIEQAEFIWNSSTVRQYIDRTGMVFSDEQRDYLIDTCRGTPIAWVVTYYGYKQERVNDDAAALKSPLDEERFNVILQKGFSKMWDYLEYHVYDCWDIELQEFLLDISIVDSFTVQLAEMVTGRNDVERLIYMAKWIGNFLFEKSQSGETVYILMKPVRTSMHRRLYRKCSKEKIRTLYENAGLYYQLNSRPLDALKMYETVGDTERIISILIDNVRKSVNAAHYYELKKYYLELPEDKVKKSPELMSGMSMLESMLLDVGESERWYKELADYARTHTGSEKRLAMSRLLYLDIELPHRGSGDMVEILKRADQLIADKQISLSGFSLTGNQASLMNGGKDFCEWSKNDRELAGSIGKTVELVLGKYGKGIVSTALAESTFEKGGDNYEVVALANKGRMQAEAGGNTDICFVADGILAWLHVVTGNASDAVELLERFCRKSESEGCERILSNIYTFITRCAMYTGDASRVQQWMEKAPDEEQGFSIYERFHYLTKIRIYIQSGKNELAYNLLSKCEYYAQVMKRIYISIEVGLLKSIIEYRNDDPVWRDNFTETLKKAEEYNFIRVISREGAAVLPLLESMEGDICVSFFYKKLTDETRKIARFYPDYLKSDRSAVALNDTAINILKLLAQGMSKEKIASELGMSTANVKYHTQQVYRKLGVSSKTEAVMEAGKRGII